MLFDALNRFSDKQEVSGEAESENVVDLGVDRDLAVGTPLEVVVVPCTADGSDLTGEGTLTVALETDDDEAFSEAKTLGATDEITVEELNAGAVGFKLPYGGKRYLRLKYTVSGEITGLLVTSGLVLATRHDIQYKRLMHS